MSPLDDTLEALLALATADDAAAIYPVNRAIDGFTLAVGGTLDDRIFALIALREAFERARRQTEVARYVLLVIEQRRRLLALEWQEAYRAGAIDRN